MRRIVGLAVLLAVGGSAGAAVPEHPGLEVGAAPGWVVPVLSADAPPSADPEAGSAVEHLLVDFQARIDGDATAEYSRFVSRALSPAGLGDLAEREITFDPAFQRLTLHRLTLIRDGVAAARLAEAEINVVQREPNFARRMYDGSLSVLVVVPDVRVGDVVDLSYTITGFNPVFSGRVFGGLTMGWWTPVGRRHVRLLHRPSDPVRTAVHGPLEVTPAVRSDGEWTERVWDLRDLPAADGDEQSPEDWEATSWLQYTQFGSWSEVARWADSIYQYDGRDPAIRAAVAEAIAGEASLEQRATAVTRWVQDELRYFAVVLGRNSHQPHDPATTLRQRYGDCKDKSLLLVSMLRAIGLEAWPALVSTDRGRLLPTRLPSPGDFNHVIVSAELDGRPVWIDPTWALQGGPFTATRVPDYGYALVVRPDEKGLTRVSADQTRPGLVSVVNHYRFDPDGIGCSVEISTEYHGSEADGLRYDLAETTVEDLQESYVSFYSTAAGTVIPEAPLAVDDDRLANRVTVVERYRLEDWWTEDADGTTFELLPLILDEVLVPADLVERTAPLAIPRDVRRREVIRIEAPDAWRLTPVELAVDEPWAQFSASSTTGSGFLEIVYELHTGDGPVPREHVADYNHSVEAMRDATYYTITDGGSDQRASDADGGTSARTAALTALAAVVGIAGLLSALVGLVLVRARLL